jgi:hypothetical protein
MEFSLDLLKEITGTADFAKISCLNLENLSMINCPRELPEELHHALKILILRINFIKSIELPSLFKLRKLDISSNQIETIGEEDMWVYFPALEVVYLHDNLIDYWDALYTLATLPRVKHITLFNNPIVRQSEYREFMVSKIPTLLALDFHIVSEGEKKGIYTLPYEKTKVWISDSEDVKALNWFIYKLKRKWEKCSAATLIQALWRRYCIRKNYGTILTDRDKSAIVIQRHVRGWLLRKKLRTDLQNLLKETNTEYLLYSVEDYNRFRAVQVIEKYYLEIYLKNKRHQRLLNACALKIQTAFRRWYSMRSLNPLFKDGKIYILKSQQRTFISMIRALSIFGLDRFHPSQSIKDVVAPKFFEKVRLRKLPVNYIALVNSVKECKSVKVVRFVEPEMLEMDWRPAIWYNRWMFNCLMLDSLDHKPIGKKPITLKYHNTSKYPQILKIKPKPYHLSAFERRKLKNLKISLDDYHDLLELSVPHSEFTIGLASLVVSYNKYVKAKDEPPFILFFDTQIKRLKAACKIQTWWRGYLTSHWNTTTLEVLKSRAVHTISSWWKMVPFFRRIRFLEQLKKHLDSFTEPVGYIQEHLYECIKPTMKNLRFIEQDITWYMIGNECYQARFDNKKPILPMWVGAHMKEYHEGMNGLGINPCKLIDLVNVGTYIEIVKLSSQITNKQPITDGEIRFLKVTFSSIEELKCRTAVLMLGTLENRYNSYITFMSRATLEETFLMSRMRFLWSSRGVDKSRRTVVDTQISTVRAKSATREPSLNAVTSITPEEKEEAPEDISTIVKIARNHQSASNSHKIEEVEILKARVKLAREENTRRIAEIKFARQIQVAARQEAHREDKDRTEEAKDWRLTLDFREKLLRKRLVQAQHDKQKALKEEREFIKTFAQSKNLIQKLMIKSDLTRWRKQEDSSIRETVTKRKKKKYGDNSIVISEKINNLSSYL